MCQGGNQEDIYLIRRGRLGTIEQWLLGYVAAELSIKIILLSSIRENQGVSAAFEGIITRETVVLLGKR